MVVRTEQGQLTGTEQVLAEAVRSWATRTAPDEPEAGAAAVAAALEVFHAGRSASEACDAARTLLGCWMRHPSRGRASRLRLATAS